LINNNRLLKPDVRRSKTSTNQSLHDALAISEALPGPGDEGVIHLDPAQRGYPEKQDDDTEQGQVADQRGGGGQRLGGHARQGGQDRKSTRLNSSHVKSSYAACC